MRSIKKGEDRSGSTWGRPRGEIIGPTETRILRAIMQNPGITISEVCRALNGHHVRDCYHCRDFANPERRQRTRIDTPGCKPRLWTVRKAIYRLRQKRVIRAQREKVADSRMRRGWDWVMRLYPNF